MSRGTWKALAGLVALVLVWVGAVAHLAERGEAGPRPGAEMAAASLPRPTVLALRVTSGDPGAASQRSTRTPEGCETTPDRASTVCPHIRSTDLVRTVAALGVSGTVHHQNELCCWLQGDHIIEARRAASGERGTDWSIPPMALKGRVGQDLVTQIEPAPEPPTGPSQDVWIELPEGVSVFQTDDPLLHDASWCGASQKRPRWVHCRFIEVYPTALGLRVDRKLDSAKGRMIMGWTPDDPNPANNTAELTLDFR